MNRILFVDDDPNTLQAYQRSLRRRFCLETASGGEEALDRIARRGPYDVIVADMRMPGMTGAELLAAAQRLAPQTVRILLTGNADEETPRKAAAVGRVFRFLTKPCPPEVLVEAVVAGIAQYRQNLAAPPVEPEPCSPFIDTWVIDVANQ